MNHRSFLKFAGLAPVVPALVGGLLAESTQINTTGRPMFRALESGKKGDVIACEITWDDGFLPEKEAVYRHSWTPGIDSSYTFKIDMTEHEMNQFKKLFGL